jgi:hypothetical protein
MSVKPMAVPMAVPMIIEIKYQRVHNLGNYETERVELTALLDAEDDANKIYLALKAQALEMLGVVE